MSKLNSLFGSGEDSSLDALKYSAPKEPKASGQTKALDVNLTQNVNIITPKPTSSVQSSTTSNQGSSNKIMASAAVRLYKVNPATGAFEPHEGGTMLGCVLMGIGLNFQILVYNGQKIPQATVNLTPGFLFSVRDLYMSFSDGIGGQWSILFEQHKVMYTYLRSLTSSLAHIAMYHDSPVPLIKSLAPSSITGDDLQLSSGMAAGIYYSIWELGGPSDNPNDIISGPSYKELVAPNEVLKVKLGGNDDLIGGMSDALIGSKKGDKIWLGLPPNKASLGTIDFSDRSRPSTWIFVEIEVIKVKEKKEKKTKSKDNEENYEQALTIVGNEEARSYYLDTNKPTQAPSAAPAVNSNPSMNQTPNNPSQVNHTSNSYINEQWGGQQLNQLQQQMLNIQNSIMQLHGKVDGLGMQLTTSSSMQMGINPMGLNSNNMGMGMGMSMGMTPMQQQMQMQLMQQQMNQQFMSSGLPKPSTTSRAPIRIKSEELISTIESIVNDYETCINENSGAGKDAKETISKLEEKVENLQARNEKLMIEKSTLLEKHADMLQMGADTSNKTFALQQEAENLRREKMQLEVRINDLSNALERSLNASRTSDEDKNKQAQFEREILSLTALEKAAQEENNRLKLLLEEQQSNSKKLVEDLSYEKTKNMELSEEINVINGKLSASLEEAKVEVPIDMNSDEVQSYVNSRIEEEVSKIQSTLSEVETNLASVNDDNVKLQKELETLKESQPSSSGSSTSAEDLKSIMQDVYVKACEIFVPSDDNDTPSYSSQDIVKRLRSVLKSVTNERSK